MLMRLFVFVGAASVVGLRLDIDDPRFMTSKTSLISTNGEADGRRRRKRCGVKCIREKLKQKKEKADRWIQEKFFAKKRAEEAKKKEELAAANHAAEAERAKAHAATEARIKQEEAAAEKAKEAAKAVEELKKKEEAAAKEEPAAAAEVAAEEKRAAAPPPMPAKDAWVHQCDSLSGLVSPYYVSKKDELTQVVCVPGQCKGKLGRSNDNEVNTAAQCYFEEMQDSCCTDMVKTPCGGGGLPCVLGDVSSIEQYQHAAVAEAKGEDLQAVAGDCVGKAGGEGPVQDFESRINAGTTTTSATPTNTATTTTTTTTTTTATTTATGTGHFSFEVGDGGAKSKAKGGAKSKAKGGAKSKAKGGAKSKAKGGAKSKAKGGAKSKAKGAFERN